MSINQVFLHGNLGQDPVLRYTQGGQAVTELSLATTEKWTDKDQNAQEKTEWHRVIVWGKMAEHCNQYLNKGDSAIVTGRISYRSFEDKTGNKRFATDIVATRVEFTSKKQMKETKSNSDAKPEPKQQSLLEKEYVITNETNFTGDDIPF